MNNEQSSQNLSSGSSSPVSDNSHVSRTSNSSSTGSQPLHGSGQVGSTSYGGGSGGNKASSSEPTLVKAEPANGEVVFSWKNPGETNFVRIVVVRKEGTYPTSPLDGTTIYEGRSETFTDTNIQNGTTYYYSVYSYNHDKIYSVPINVSVAPVALNKEVKYDESGFTIPLSPVDHFTQIFKKGYTDIDI